MKKENNYNMSGGDHAEDGLSVATSLLEYLRYSSAVVKAIAFSEGVDKGMNAMLGYQIAVNLIFGVVVNIIGGRDSGDDLQGIFDKGGFVFKLITDEVLKVVDKYKNREDVETFGDDFEKMYRTLDMSVSVLYRYIKDVAEGKVGDLINPAIAENKDGEDVISEFFKILNGDKENGKDN